MAQIGWDKKQEDYLKYLVDQKKYSTIELTDKMNTKFKTSRSKLSVGKKIQSKEWHAVGKPALTLAHSATTMEMWLGLKRSGSTYQQISDLSNGEYSASLIKTAVPRWINLRKQIVKDIKKKLEPSKMMKHYKLTKLEYERFEKMASSADSVWSDHNTWKSEDADEILDLMEHAGKILGKTEMKTIDMNMQIKTSLPYVGIIMSSDWHLGSLHTDMERLREDVGLIVDTPGLYTGFLGDACDSFINKGPHLGGINDATVSVKAQRLAATRLFEILQQKKKVLFATNSCHNRWAIEAADYDFQEDLCKRLNIPYLGHGGSINLQFVDNKKNPHKVWRIHAAHKPGRGGGGVHKYNANKTYLMNEDMSCDIIAFGHFHINASAVEFFQGKRRAFFRSGVYKMRDSFSDELDVQSQGVESHSPMLILGTNTNFMQAVSYIPDGIKILTALNRK